MERDHAPHVHVTASTATEGGGSGLEKTFKKGDYRRLWDPGGGGGGVGVGRRRGRAFQSASPLAAAARN